MSVHTRVDGPNNGNLTLQYNAATGRYTLRYGVDQKGDYVEIRDISAASVQALFGPFWRGYQRQQAGRAPSPRLGPPDIFESFEQWTERKKTPKKAKRKAT